MADLPSSVLAFIAANDTRTSLLIRLISLYAQVNSEDRVNQITQAQRALLTANDAYDAAFSVFSQTVSGTLPTSPTTGTGGTIDTTGLATDAKLETIRAILANPPLAAGAASEATMQALKAAVQAQVDLANLLVTDGTNFYVRRETVYESTGAVVVSFTTLAGNPAVPPDLTLLKPVSATASSGTGGTTTGNTRTVETALFDVLTAGNGTSVNDIVARVLVYDTSTNAIVASYWHNLTTGLALGVAPTASAILEQARTLPVGASKDATLQSILTALAPLSSAGTDSSLQSILSKLEAVRVLMAAPALPSGAATDLSVQAGTTKLEAIRSLLATPPALPSNAATETTLQSIKAAIQAQVDLANLIVTDGNGYYVRRETVNEGTGAVTVTFTTLAGAAASPNTAALTPVVSSGGSGGTSSTRVVETALFDVVTAGTGTSVGDLIARVIVYDTAANSVVASYWHNLTTGAALSTAPSASAIVEQARNLPVGAAKDTSLQSILSALSALAVDSSVQTVATKAEAIRALLAGTLAVSAGSLPLPAGAATAAKQDTGNTSLASIDGKIPTAGAKTAANSLPVAISTDGVIANAFGTTSDTVTTDVTANGASYTFTSLFKGMVTNLKTLASRLPAALGVTTSAGALPVVLASDQAAVPVTGSFYQATQPVSGSVTANIGSLNGAATDATLQAIKSALLAQIDFSSSLVTDGTNFYVRRESLNEGTGAITVSFTDIAGNSASPTVANLVPAASSNTRTVETALFDVTTAGTGTSVGDVVARVIVYDTRVNSIAASYWHNLTTGAALASAPAAGSVVEQVRNLAAGASTSALQTSGNASLTSIASALAGILGISSTDGALATVGAKADAAAAFGAASASVVALLKNIATSDAPFQGVIALTAGTAGTPGRAIRINCTAAGNVTLTYADGSTDTVPVAVGLSYLPGAITTAAIPSSGGATATFANMK